jgi:hypothetical protein
MWFLKTLLRSGINVTKYFPRKLYYFLYMGDEDVGAFAFFSRKNVNIV